MIQRVSWKRLPVAIVLTLGAGATMAENDPWYLGVSQAISYNTNVFRQIDQFAQASWWSSTSLVGGFDQRYGRQRFFGSGNVAANVYGQVNNLDNTSYALNAGWDWETVERLSGRLYASYSQNLADYGGFNVSLQNQKNIQDSGLLEATVNYGLLSLWLADVRVAYSTVHYSLQSYDQYELDQASIQARLRKQFSGQLTAGAGMAYTSGDYFAIGQEFDRFDLFATFNWSVTGQSSLSGRLGYRWTEYTGFNPYNQDGFAGWFVWSYNPTGKLKFDTILSYDTQANSVFTSVGSGSASGLGQNQWLTAGLQVNATYAFSAKTSFNAALQFFSQKRDQVFNVSGQPTAFDSRNQVTNLQLGGTWTPSRNWQVQCNLTLNDRNLSGSVNPSSLLPYSAYGGSCSAQFVLQ
ncbi:MAG: hypothetical protein J0M00_09320 [Burkholderiales bacterium]|nr:hypothetical protein [Burkholderiales bacterium]